MKNNTNKILALKYRPKNFEELIGQDIMVQTIINSIIFKGEKDLSRKINIPVVSNFRDKDILSGGQGAPIGCFYHKYLIKKINMNSVILNIGGVSNITFLLNKKLIK